MTRGTRHGNFNVSMKVVLRITVGDGVPLGKTRGTADNGPRSLPRLVTAIKDSIPT
jgi:hypothetical protein